MKMKALVCIVLVAAMLMCMVACGAKTSENKTNTKVEIKNDLNIPEPYLEQLARLLSEWEVRQGSMSDPLIGTRLLMYDNVKKAVKSKDEIGFMIVDLDGNGIDELVTAPVDEYSSNGTVYDIITLKDGKVWHLVNSLQATYHLCEDNSFILRTPTADNTYSFKNVIINGDKAPIETVITKEESATYVLSQLPLTPFSALEK